MNPATERQAGQVAAFLVSKQLKGVASSTKRRRVARARFIAETIWRRWSVGIYRWQLKHVRWAMQHGLGDIRPHVKYQYWLVMRTLLLITGKDRWLSSLEGGWCWPDGKVRGIPLGQEGNQKFVGSRRQPVD